MRIYLIGYMGCGKSSLGKKLSRALEIPFIDTDAEVEKEENRTIAQIMDEDGEEYFRFQEYRALLSTMDVPSAVISTGGGLPVWRNNMDKINDLGVSFYLKRSPEQIISRLSPYGREKRPKFRGKSDEELLAFMKEHMAQREPYYSKATHIIECAMLSDNDIIEKIREICG